MAVESYTSFDDIRAALGVEKDELRDDTLSLDLYSNHLDSELEDISVSLAEDYATVAAIDPPSSRTALQARFYRTTRQFATFSVAKLALTALPMTPKEVTDEKVAVTRFALDPYKETAKRVEAEYGTASARVSDAYAAFKSTSAAGIVIPQLMGTAGLSVDPVTGA